MSTPDGQAQLNGSAEHQVAQTSTATPQANGSHPQSGPQEVLEMLSVLHDAQAQRAEVYNNMQTRFQQYLAGGSEGDFRTALAESTGFFQVCSDAVRTTVGRLESEAQRSDLATLLRSLQAEERKKLHFTLILMALRKAEALKGFSWHPTAANTAQPSQTGHGGGEHGHACADAPEPTEEEFQNAVREATQGLQDATGVINGVLEEIRYEEAELRGEAC